MTRAQIVDAELLYEKALLTLKTRAWSMADSQLHLYLERYPDGERVVAVLEMLKLTNFLKQLPQRKWEGRTEFAVFSTLYGLWLGGALGFIGDLEEGATILALLCGGGGLGLALGLTSDGHGLTSGQASLLTAAGFWGTFNGLALSLGADVDEDTQIVAITLGTGILALTGAGAMATVSDPDPGDISLASSGGFWGSLLALTTILIVQPATFQEEDFLTAMAIGADIGIIAGAITAGNVEVSSGRMWLINVGGLAGLLLSAVGSANFAENSSTAVTGSMLMLGILGGLAGGALITRDFDAHRPTAAGIDLDLPTVFVAPRRGEQAVVYGVNFLQGRF